MTKEKAIQLLRAIQEPEAWELPITQDAYLALDMAIEELKIKDKEEKNSVDSVKRLNDLIFDINPAEICSQIESDNLKNWCKTIQTEMKMAMVQLPRWGSESE